jgi:hypothetical protein
MKYGVEGYGLYFYCIEIIAGNLTSENITFELKHDAETIAYRLKMDTLKVEEIMKFCLDEGLFQYNTSTERIMCLGLGKRLDVSTSNNPEVKKIISNYQKLLDSNSRIEENRIDKNRKEENKKEDSSLSDFQKHIELWNSLMLPQYRGTGLNIPNITALKAYSFNEIQSAIKNYNSILHSSKYDAFPVYTGFAGFIEKGIEKYADDAFPFERCLTEEEKRRQKENARASPPNTYEEISDPRENNQLSPEETAELLGKFK